MQTFTNQAQLTYDGKTTSSNIAKGEIVQMLSVSKRALLPNYYYGDEKTFVISIVNTGTTAFTDLTLTDNLGGYQFTQTGAAEATTLYPLSYVADSLQYYQNGTLQTTPTVTTANGLQISGINVPAGGNVTLIYKARTNEYAPLDIDDTILNTVTVTGAGITSPLTATETIETLDDPYLTINKTISPRQVSANGQVTYSFTIQNLGNTAAVANDNVQVIDTFSPILSDIVVTYNGQALTATDYTYDADTGVFSTTPGYITVPAATYAQNALTGIRSIVPSEVVLEVTGTITGSTEN